MAPCTARLSRTFGSSSCWRLSMAFAARLRGQHEIAGHEVEAALRAR